MRILVVDDDESVLMLLERILTSSGANDVVTAASGRAALQEISNAIDPFGCVLVDIQMPDLEGISLTRMIRQTPGYSDTAILMLTAMQDKRYLDSAFSAGATDYVTKPFDFLDLLVRIRDAHATSRRKKDLQGNAMMAGELKKMGGEQKDFRLEDPVFFHGTDALINDREFENYLVELTRRKPRPMNAVAAKILDVERLYGSCTSEAFLKILEDVVAAIKAKLLGKEGILSYRGGGVFLWVNEGVPTDMRRYGQSEVNSCLRNIRSMDEKTHVQVLLGNSVLVVLNSKLDAIESLSNAVASLDDVGIPDGQAFLFSKRLLGRRQMAAEQDRLDHRAFVHLLNDTLPTIKNDAWAEKLKKRARR